MKIGQIQKRQIERKKEEEEEERKRKEQESAEAFSGLKMENVQKIKGVGSVNCEEKKIMVSLCKQKP